MATYRIGLAMAGAVSAGAYSAGVLDFLIEALDAWHDAKARGDAVPQHDVTLNVASGASAGSMCSALLAVALPYAFGHVRLDASRKPVGDASGNPFYQAWVERIGMDALLDTTDLSGGRLPSYLNSAVVDRILGDTLAYRATPKPRPWVAQPFVARFSVGNLRGVPYAVPTRGSFSSADGLIEHVDNMSFAIASQPLSAEWTDKLSDHFLLLPHDHALDEEQRKRWQALGQAALASGAFPLFLRPRMLSRPAAHYRCRHVVDGAQVAPDWHGSEPDPYDFVSVDGGVFDNEPFELAHSALLLIDRRTHNPRGSAFADSSVLMIDPFVHNDGAPAEFGVEPLEGLLARLISAWTMQARFRPQELVAADDPQIYSRYLVAPKRSGTPPAPTAHPLACGGLGGFFGFFHPEFRKHDYQLGRRNCQRFLSEYFTIPGDNAILAAGYAGLSQAERRRYSRSDGTELQIVPVMQHLQTEEPQPLWPAQLLDLRKLQPLIERRIDAVYEHYRDRLVATGGNWFARKAVQGYLWTGWKAGGVRAKLVNLIMAKLNAAQREQGL